MTNWPTPAARDHKGANAADHLDNGTGRKHLGQLPNFVEHIWATPRAHEVGQYTRDRGDPEKQRASLTGQAMSADFLYSVRLPERSPTGAPSLKERRSLNPLFVEWLMGWPPGWTLLVWTDFACSETALCRYRQLMRCELLSFAPPPAAPAPQLSLFG